MRSRGLVVTAVVVGIIAAVSVLVLTMGEPSPEASAVLLPLGGLAAGVTCVWRALLSSGSRRHAWTLLGAAAAIAAVGNIVVALVVGGTLTGPLTDATVGLALAFAIAGVLVFPSRRVTGTEAVTRLLDGLVGGCAALIMASALVYSPLLAATEGGALDRVVVLVLPVLDVVLVTAVASQVARADSPDRPTLTLLMLGFACYAIGDLHYAVEAAGSGYEFGTWTDLGWILGYLLIAVAGAVPPGSAREERPRSGSILSTGVVFAVILGAGMVQVVSGIPRDVRLATGALWLVLLVAAAARQMLLIGENQRLRKGLERKVAAQTADLRHLLRERSVLIDSVADGIYAVDVDGRITLMNRSAREMLGIEGEPDRSRHAHDLFHTPLEGVPDALAVCYITEAIELGVVAASEDDIYVRADGSRVEVEITAGPILEDDGTVSGAVVAFRDATQRREVERMKEQFLSVVSHELRTPLTAIRGSLGMLTEGDLVPLEPPAPRLLQMASENTERLARLVNDILDVERLTSGHVRMKLEQHLVNDLLRDAARTLTPLAETRGIRLVVEYDGDALVIADADRFAQVVANLVGNAVKFSVSGTTIRLSADPRGDDLLFGVHDQGRGIPAHQLAAVFERFRQVDSSDVRREGGMGLGLAITREIVHQMHGTIWVTSELGVGTDFWFTLPRSTRDHGDGVGVPSRTTSDTIIEE